MSTTMLKNFIKVAGLTTALSACASTADVSDPGATGSLFSAQRTTQQQNHEPKEPAGMILKRGGFQNPYTAEFCNAPDQFVRDSKGRTAYCFDKNDIKVAFNNDIMPGAQMQQRGPNVGDMMMGQIKRRATRGIESRDDRNKSWGLGANGKGGVNLFNNMAKVDEYKRTCMEAFAFRNPHSQINGILKETPAQLGTFDNCVSKLRIATSVHSMGRIQIKF